MPACIAFSTCPDPDSARTIARALVQERLAACVQMLPGMTSVYRWEGAVQEEGEILLLIKTRGERIAALRQRLPELHPYSVPQLTVVEVSDGLPAYLDWLVAETRLP